MLRSVIAVAVIIAFVSCTNNSKSELAVYRAMNDGLQTSNRVIVSSSELIYRSLQSKLDDRETKERAMIWQPKAAVIKKLSEDMASYITQLKTELTDAAGKDENNTNEAFRENNTTAANMLFDEKKRGVELLAKLLKYQQDVLAIDSDMNDQLKHILPPVTGRFDHTKNDPKEFTNTFFKDVPAIAAMCMLTKFENTVRVIENILVNYCINQTYVIHGCGFGSSPRAIIEQSSSYVQAGETIEISAGIGTFYSQAEPEIKINGKTIKVDYGGLGVYKLKSSTVPGKHEVPVAISYINPDGTRQTIERTIVYTVAQ
jgi:gliding motility-associated protein GldM